MSIEYKVEIEKSTAILDEILNSERSPFDKIVLRYTGEGSSSTMKKDEEEPNRDAFILKESIKNEEYNKNRNYDQRKLSFFQDRNESINIMTTRISPIDRYTNLFLGNFFACKKIWS